MPDAWSDMGMNTQVCQVKASAGEDLVDPLVNMDCRDVASDHPLRLGRAIPKVLARATVEQDVFGPR